MLATLTLVLTLVAVVLIAIGGWLLERRLWRFCSRIEERMAKAEEATLDADEKAWRAHLRLDRMRDAAETRRADWRDSLDLTKINWRDPGPF